MIMNDYVNAVHDAASVNEPNVTVNNEHVDESAAHTPMDNAASDVSVNELPDVPANVYDVVQPEPTARPSFVLTHERPKLPNFYGDVRQYFIFKADFQHAVQSRCSERDAITILRSCLGPEPVKLIEGIVSDLEAAWMYLDQNYGDPRVVSDTVTSDLEKFKAIQVGEDHRFYDLVNLVRRSYNILREVQRPQDIDNTHVIALIERKMTKDDLKVWARHIYLQKLEPSMANLLSWMEDEMTARLRSGASIRKGGASTRSSVSTVQCDVAVKNAPPKNASPVSSDASPMCVKKAIM